MVGVIGELQGEINNLQKVANNIDSDSWRWMTEVMLPTEMRRIEHGRNEIDPDDGIKQAMAQGQINEIIHLQEISGSVIATLNQLQSQIEIARETETKLRKRSEKR